MSVIVKGMQMPKNCAECPVALSGKYCRINQTYTTYIKLPIRPDHCPLVELPQHHGRLIDADALVPDICHDWEGGRIPPDYYSEECIREAPTVIESEGEE